MALAHVVRHIVNAPSCSFLALNNSSLPGRRAGTSSSTILLGILVVFLFPKLTFMEPQRMEIGVLLVVSPLYINTNIFSMNMSINMPAQRGMSYFLTPNMKVQYMWDWLNNRAPETPRLATFKFQSSHIWRPHYTKQILKRNINLPSKRQIYIQKCY